MKERVRGERKPPQIKEKEREDLKILLVSYERSNRTIVI